MVAAASAAAESCRRAVRSVRNAAVDEASDAINIIDLRRASEAAIQKLYLKSISDIDAMLDRKRSDLLG